MSDLNEIRRKIGECDDKIIRALAQRMNYIEEVIAYKRTHGVPILQPEQEEKQNRVLREKLDKKDYEEEILDIFKYIVKNSKKIQAKSLFSYNIMLIGFMGVGKSTVSSYLSEMLAMEEVEMDALIVQKEGMSINEIFETYGEIYFRNCESNTLIELEKRDHVIVSCGGGAVLREENVESMKRRGRIVLLTASPEVIYERVKDSKERPILNENMSVEFIAGLLEKRRAKYESAADITVNTDHKSVQQICEELIGSLTAMEG